MLLSIISIRIIIIIISIMFIIIISSSSSSSIVIIIIIISIIIRSSSSSSIRITSIRVRRESASFRRLARLAATACGLLLLVVLLWSYSYLFN